MLTYGKVKQGLREGKEAFPDGRKRKVVGFLSENSGGATTRGARLLHPGVAPLRERGEKTPLDT